MPGVWPPTLSTAAITRCQVQDQILHRGHWDDLEGLLFEGPSACSPRLGLAWNQSHELLEVTDRGTEHGLCCGKCCNSRCESPGNCTSDEVACLTSDVANAPQKPAAVLAETLVPSLIPLLMASKRVSMCSVAAQIVFLAGVFPNTFAEAAAPITPMSL